ncbi:MAG: hypothetical protein L0Y66_08340 [Myxococcaceae bacterium]|nr:hypothetical protein [Myxococcaceae bacterium]MCI0671242.1 hypothetical protein [Myxococcaceae bacterium]
MSGQMLSTQLLEGAREWVGRLPTVLARHVTVDVARRRLRVSHARVEALTRRLLSDVHALEVHSWSSLPHVYDVRLSAAGWRLRVELTLERVELASGQFTVWLRTPGRVEVEESRAASLLMKGVMKNGAGRAALGVLLDKLLPPGLRWDGQRFQVKGLLPREGVVTASLFEASALTLAAEHCPDGLWLSAEAWPGLVDLLQAVMGADVAPSPPGV